MKYVKLLVALVFVSFVAGNYYKNHGYYPVALESAPWRSFFLVAGIVFFLGYFYLSLFRHKAMLHFRLTAWKVWIFFSLLVVFLMIFLIFAKPVAVYTGFPVYQLNDGSLMIMDKPGQAVPVGSKLFLSNNQLVNPKSTYPTEVQQDVKKPTLLKTILSGLIIMMVTFVEWFLVLLLLYSTGSSIYYWGDQRFGFRKKEERTVFDEFTDFLLSIGIGLFVVSLLLFVLASIGILNNWSALILGVLLLAVFQKQARKFVQLFVNGGLEINTAFFSSEVFFGGIFLVFAGLNFIDNVRKFPNGWDAAERYLNFANLIAQNGILIGGSHPYFWEIFISSGFLSPRGITAALGLTFLFGLLAMLSTFLVLRYFLSRKIAVMLTAIFFSLPFVFFQSYGDPKTDLPLLFVSNLALIAFLQWFSRHSKDKAGHPHNLEPKENVFLYLTFFFLGFGLGIKYTIILFILAMISFLLFRYFRFAGLSAGLLLAAMIFVFQGSLDIGKSFYVSHKNILLSIFFLLFVFSLFFIFRHSGKYFKKLVVHFVLLLAALLIPFSPWMIKGSAEAKNFSFSALMFGKSSAPYETLRDLDVDSSQCSSSGFNEDYQRYIGFSSTLKNYLYLPWTITMNTYTKGIFIDMSFIFLALLPLALLFLRKSFSDPLSRNFLLLALIFWIFWIFNGKAIIWYAMAGFPLLLLFLGFIIKDSAEKQTAPYYFFSGVFVLWIVSSLTLRLYSSADAAILLYSTGTANAHDSLSLVVPGYDIMNDTFVKDTAADNKYLLRIATPYGYFISDNNRRMINDQFLDKFACLYKEGDAKLTLQRLKAMGVKYILLDKWIPTIAQSEEQSLTKKFNAFVEFAKNLEVVYETPEYRNTAFYRVP